MRSPNPPASIPLPAGALLLAITAACGPTKSTQSTDTTGDTTTTDATTTPTTTDPSPAACPEHPTTDACCCFVDLALPDMTIGGTMNTCSSPVLCTPMTFTCTGSEDPDCASDILETADTAAIDCALQALADGAIGRLSWEFDDGYFHARVSLDLVGDATAFRQGGHIEDFSIIVDPVEHLPLAPATDYQECLADPDWRARFECIRQPLKSTPLATCIDGYSYTPRGL